MSGGIAGLRKQIAELRTLAAHFADPEPQAHDEDPIVWAERVSGLVLDPWQRDVLLAKDARLAILCCRQSGKSTTVALKAADLVRRGGMAVVVAPSLRQSSLLFRTLNRLLVAGGESFRHETATELETLRGGLALCLPGDRPMWATISPMLAAAPLAHQALLSTPAGASGEFHRVMTSHEPGWKRITVRANDCPRIASAFLARERIRLGEALFEQEYECKFVAAPGSVFSADVLAAMFGDAGVEIEEQQSPPEPAAAGRFLF
jgi:hypothetical protein